MEKIAKEYEAKVKLDRIHQLEKLIEKIGCTSLAIRKVFRVGVPFRELISAIEDEGADLMVIGQKGRDDFTDVVFGSMAQKVFRRCPVPY